MYYVCVNISFDTMDLSDVLKKLIECYETIIASMNSSSSALSLQTWTTEENLNARLSVLKKRGRPSYGDLLDIQVLAWKYHFQVVVWQWNYDMQKFSSYCDTLDCRSTVTNNNHQVYGSQRSTAYLLWVNTGASYKNGGSNHWELLRPKESDTQHVDNFNITNWLCSESDILEVLPNDFHAEGGQDLAANAAPPPAISQPMNLNAAAFDTTLTLASVSSASAFVGPASASSTSPSNEDPQRRIINPPPPILAEYSFRVSGNYDTHNTVEDYEILGLDFNYFTLTLDNVNTQYKQLAKMSHPDRYPVNRNPVWHDRATDNMKIYNSAKAEVDAVVSGRLLY